MTIENQHKPSTPPADSKSIPFGTRLKSAREALGLDPKDAAAQLRLNENVISMMEKDKFPSDLPVTFVRGYLRAYAKLLQIPEHEVRKAIEPIKEKPVSIDAPQLKPSISLPESISNDNSLMQLFSYLILFTLIGLTTFWWYNHKPTTAPASSEETTAVSAPASIAPTVPATNETTRATTTDTSAETSAETSSMQAPAKGDIAPASIDQNSPGKRPGVAPVDKTSTSHNTSSKAAAMEDDDSSDDATTTHVSQNSDPAEDNTADE